MSEQEEEREDVVVGRKETENSWHPLPTVTYFLISWPASAEPTAIVTDGRHSKVAAATSTGLTHKDDVMGGGNPNCDWPTSPATKIKQFLFFYVSIILAPASEKNSSLDFIR